MALSCVRCIGWKLGLNVRAALMLTHLRAAERHLPYVITQCYLTQVNVPCLNRRQTDSIYLPRSDGRLS